jgi:hypothetical protein
MLKVWLKFLKILHVQNTQTLITQIFIFFQTSFFLPNEHQSFWKLKRILTLMIKKAKRLELIFKKFITDISTFGSKVFLTLKIMDFENVL